MRWLLLAAVFTLPAGPLWAQARTSDEDTLQLILQELRALHRDMRLNASTQLLLAELQVEQTTLDRATQHQDALRSALGQLQVDEKVTKAEIASTEDAVRGTDDATQKSRLADRLGRLQSSVVRLSAEEQTEMDQLQDAEARVRSGQAELEETQGELKAVNKKLAAGE